MSTSKDSHRFFHAMILMGSSLALGCGGDTTGGSDSSSAGSSGAGGSDGSGASGNSGGSSAGSANAGTGGVMIGTGGSSLAGSAGTNAGPEPIEPGPFACPPEQFACDSPTSISCGFDLQGYALPQDCPCDEARPTSIMDCQAGEAFVCLNATTNHAGVPFTQNVPFDCRCVPRGECWSECYAAFQADLSCDPEAQTPTGTLCGCAVIVLK